MISSKYIQVFQNRETDSKGRGIETSLVIAFKYLDEPPFTEEQIRVFHEIAEAFLFENRMRERNRQRNDRRKAKKSAGGG